MIVSIILSILKLIGITLLCLLGLVLLLILVVLFVPIRYKVTADADINDENKDYNIKVKISWLLWFVRGKYNFPSEEGFVLKVGPFTIVGGDKKEAKPKKKTKTQDVLEEEKTTTDTEAESESIENSDNKSLEDETLGEETKAEDVHVLEDLLEEEIEAQPKTLKEKIIYTWNKICDRIKEIWLKIKGIFKNIKKYINILQSDEFKNAFSLCKDSIVRIFRMIKPRKVRIKGTVGMNSPEQTGYICGAVGVLSTFYKKQIKVTPDFERFIIEGNALIKGRIYLIVIVVIVVKVFFDKNIRKLLKMFRREEA